MVWGGTPSALKASTYVAGTTTESGASGWSIGNVGRYGANWATTSSPLVFTLRGQEIATAVPGITTTQSASTVVVEGESSSRSTFTVVLDSQPASPVTVTVTAPAELALDGPDSASAFTASEALSFTTSNWNTAQTVTVRAVDDTVDRPGRSRVEVSYTTSSTDTSYNALTGTAAALRFVDDDPTSVTLAAIDSVLAEGESTTLTITLGRDLEAGESVQVPITLDGTGITTDDYRLRLAFEAGLNTGVSLLTSFPYSQAEPEVHFQGGDATEQTATLFFAAIDDGADERTETLSIGFDTILSNLDRIDRGTEGPEGTTAAGAPISVRIQSIDLAPTLTVSGVPGWITDRSPWTVIFSFSEPVTGFDAADVTVSGGAKGTFTAESGASVYTLVVTPDDGADVVVTVPADAATDGGLNTGPAAELQARAVWVEAENVPVTPLRSESTGPHGVDLSGHRVLVRVQVGTASYTMRLRSAPEPGETVTVTPRSGDTSVVTVSGPVSFTDENWNLPQRVVVTGVSGGWTLVHHAITVGGANYPPTLAVDSLVAGVVQPRRNPGDPNYFPEVTLPEGDPSLMSTFEVWMPRAPTSDVTVTFTAPEGLEIDGPSPGRSFSDTTTAIFTPGNWSAPQTLTLRTTDDEEDSPSRRAVDVRYEVASQDHNFDRQRGIASTFRLADDDPTVVTLAGDTGDLEEGKDTTFTLLLSRALVAGETLPVPLTFGGAATPGLDFKVRCPYPRPKGVTCDGLDTPSPTVTFTGPSAASVTLTLKTLNDGMFEDEGETVEIGLGALDAQSGTGLDGGARGEVTLGTFFIIDPTLTISGLTRPITDRWPRMVIFTFSEKVKEFDANEDVIVDGGTTEGRQVEMAPVAGGPHFDGRIYRLFVTPDGDKDLTVTVRANSVKTVAHRHLVPDRSVAKTVYWDPCGETSADLVSMVQRYYRENRDRENRDYGENWRRVLIAFGVPEPGPAAAPYTAAEARESEKIWEGWRPVRKELERLEACNGDDPPAAQQDSPALPEMTISGNGPVTEGAGAVFTVRRTGDASAALTVLLSVSEDEIDGQDFVAADDEGDRQVIIEAGQTEVTYTVPTTDDGTDEPDGTVTVTLTPGTGYTVPTARDSADTPEGTGDTMGTASVSVMDNDGTPNSTFVPDAQLVADIRQWRAETQHGQAHIDRWTRVLIALGVETGTLAPMSSTEAQTYAAPGGANYL